MLRPADSYRILCLAPSAELRAVFERLSGTPSKIWQWSSSFRAIGRTDNFLYLSPDRRDCAYCLEANLEYRDYEEAITNHWLELGIGPREAAFELQPACGDVDLHEETIRK